MRAVLLLMVVVGCASTPAPAPVALATPYPPAATPAAAAAPAPAKAADRDEAAVIAASHAYFDAIDRFDADAVAAQLAPGFAFYRSARFMPREMYVSALRSQAASKLAARTRTWGEEHVFRSGDVATFVGYATVHIPATDDVPAHDSSGFHTIVWVRGETWAIAHQQWDRQDDSAEKESWNDALVNAGFNRKPNQTLVEAVKGRKPGKALDIAMGQGRNALFLASQGWKTTGVDFAETGIKLAKEAAAKQKLQLDAIVADMETWDLGTNRWDLVTMIYAGADPAMVERAKKSLKKGGVFVAEYFWAENETAKKQGAGGFMTGELAVAFKDGYKVLRDEVVETKPDWGPGGTMKVVKFVAQKL